MEYSQTITVYEAVEPRASFVLKADGEPYYLVKTNKIGFDLTPKDKKSDRTTKRQASFSLQECGGGG